mmetsp:Transcript_48190/g.92120  ORF Transcript_48190/g.92120 Transcript_48190/m.92120 type:complete len:428 (+) Transcript_48190:148-1431(+)
MGRAKGSNFQERQEADGETSQEISGSKVLKGGRRGGKGRRGSESGSDGSDDDGNADHASAKRQGKKDGVNSKGNNKGKSALKCFVCNKRGHIRDECPQLAAGGVVSGKTHKGKGGTGKSHACGRGYKERRSEDAPPEALPCSPVVFVDACCHLPACFARSQHYASAAAFFSSEAAPCPPECEGVVAVCADEICLHRASERYRCWETLFLEPRVWGVLGCIPKHAAGLLEEVVQDRLEEWVEASRASLVGLAGGLDYSGGPGCREADKPAQIKAFAKVVSLAVKFSLPLMLFSSHAEQDLVQVLQKSSLPTDWKIHLASYTGDNDFLVLQIMRQYPNMYVGFDGRVTFSKAEHLRRLMFEIPLERLILQTSSPEYVPSTLPVAAANKDASSHPGMLPAIAKKLVELRDVPMLELMETVRVNVNSVYSI